MSNTTTKTFKDLGLLDNILNSITKIGFEKPTPIQEQAIPVAIKGSDILGSAQTGTGKTAAFALPMVCHLLKNPDASALVLLPTRELAAQVVDATRKMMGNVNHLKIALLIGGESMVKQLQDLKRSPKIIVGTPGRINDHLKRRSLKLNNTNFLVLDETDRMLDMGFGIQLDEIAKYLPAERQTLMFSATMPKNIMELSKKYLTNPKRIAIGDVNAVAAKVKQEIIKTNDATKYSDLIKQFDERTGSHIVFVKTKFGADRLATKINKDGNHKADALHGDLKQARRDKVISNFRGQKFRVLVATDVAARGLDIPHIENVVNYDLPQCPEDYIHRIGRTGRAGAEGVAINFLRPQDSSKWKDICKLLNPNAKEKSYIHESPFDISPLNANKEDTKRRTRTAGAFGKKGKKEKFNKNSRTWETAANGGSTVARKPKPTRGRKRR